MVPEKPRFIWSFHKLLSAERSQNLKIWRGVAGTTILLIKPALNVTYLTLV